MDSRTIIWHANIWKNEINTQIKTMELNEV